MLIATLSYSKFEKKSFSNLKTSKKMLFIL